LATAGQEEPLESVNHALRAIPKVGDDEDDATALEELLQVAGGLRKIGAGADFGLLQAGEESMELAPGGWRGAYCCGSHGQR
jgi:hypothetical protein